VIKPICSGTIRHSRLLCSSPFHAFAFLPKARAIALPFPVTNGTLISSGGKRRETEIDPSSSLIIRDATRVDDISLRVGHKLSRTKAEETSPLLELAGQQARHQSFLSLIYKKR